MKQLLASITILVLGMLTLGQTPKEGSPQPRCALTLAQSPTIRGLKLGMTAEEVLALFPGRSDSSTIRAALNDAPKAFGVARFTVSPSRDEKPYEGVNLFDFEFLDNRLTSYYVGYNGPEWDDIREFVSVLSTSLKLPRLEYWEPIDAETFRTLRCEGFEVRATISGSGGNSNYVKVTNFLAPQTVRDRQNEVKEKARQAFKP